MTNSQIPDFEGWLDLCRDPGHDGLYFLGPRQSRITFYSQQVRALHLAHALGATGQLSADERVAVVGAGAGGVTAALALAMAGAQVTLYDSAAGILRLQSASPRLLHPHIYEWPAMGALDDQAGLPILDWRADTGRAVVSHLTTEFDAARARLGLRLRLETGHTLMTVEPNGAGWRLRFSEVAGPKAYSKVVLALGFGEETSYAGADSQPYWTSGGPDISALEVGTGVSCFVSGKGDGGLTEIMALMIAGFQHPVFAREFLTQFSDDALTRAAEAAYAGLTLGDDLEDAFDRDILPVLEEADVLAWLASRLRPDRILTLNSPAPLFENGRAARLNQIMAYALLKSAPETHPMTRVAGEVADVLSGPNGASIVFKDDLHGPLASRRAVCRHGPMTDALYGFVKVQYTAHRAKAVATLTAKPELAPPLTLHPATFDHFETLKISGLGTSPEAATLVSASGRRRSTIRLALDPASNRLSEQGRITLETAARQCEGGEACEILLAVPPQSIPHAENLIRLAAASDGRIVLAAEAGVHSDWLALAPGIAQKPPPGAGYRPVGAKTKDIGTAIDICLLRLLDAGLTAVSTSASHSLVGAISPDVVAALQATWADWRPQLEADPELRARFLTWLNSVDPKGETPWPGVHAQTPDLVAALVLILATHQGQSLKPLAHVPGAQGNLSIGDGGALAIGSGCRELNGEAIWTRSDPEDWGVDALILSGTSEIDILESTDRLIRDSGSMRVSRRVRPAMILNAAKWKLPLAAGLADWVAAVQAEFKAHKDRQDQALERFK